MAGEITLLHPALAVRCAPFLVRGILAPADVYVVDAVADRYQEADVDVLLGLALAVRAPRAGHVGVDLLEVAERVDDELPARDTRPEGSPPPELPVWPERADWQARVLASALVGSPEDRRPFVRQVLGTGRTLVLTRRQWREQERLAHRLQALAQGLPAGVPDRDTLDSLIGQLFPLEPQAEAALAVRAAATRQLTVITGGPGTGKTYSIKRLLALLLTAHGDGEPRLRIELAAPTGKAAVRMAEAMAEELAALPVDEAVRQALRSLQPRTLHKLLGMRPDGSVRHGPDQPLPADVVVVDEASMVDLALMRNLVEAIAPGSRLILLGDRDQLASVEAGTVLADVVEAGLRPSQGRPSALAASVVRFTVSRRFASAPTIARIAADLQAGDAGSRGRALARMAGQGPAVEGEQMPHRVTHLGPSELGRPTPAQLDRLAEPYLDGYVRVLAAEAEASKHRWQDQGFHLTVLRAFERYRVLAVHRRGPLGVAGLEAALARRVRTALGEALHGLPSTRSQGPALPAQGGFWLGLPLLITENSYEVGLMNGDIGLVLPTAQGLAAVFPATVAGQPSTREVPLARLPAHQGALAMTVHKSQGSQFARVALVLAGQDSPIQTRELVYTGLTRASERLDWLGSVADLERALERRVARASGLGDLLGSAPERGEAEREVMESRSVLCG